MEQVCSMQETEEKILMLSLQVSYVRALSTGMFSPSYLLADFVAVQLWTKSKVC